MDGNDGLDEYVDTLDSTIDKYKNGMVGYMTALVGVSPYETSYVPNYPTITVPGNTNSDVSNTENSLLSSNAHDTKDKLTSMSCLPNSLLGKTYYNPTTQGNETRFKDRLETIKKWKEEHKQ